MVNDNKIVSLACKQWMQSDMRYSLCCGDVQYNKIWNIKTVICIKKIKENLFLHILFKEIPSRIKIVFSNLPVQSANLEANYHMWSVNDSWIFESEKLRWQVP